MNTHTDAERRVVASYDAVPAALKAVPQWVVWRAQPTLDGRTTKVPFTTMGTNASSTRRETWTTFAEAVAYERAHPGIIAGIGFVVTAEDAWVGLDFDHVLELTPTAPEPRTIEPWAHDILFRLQSYAEISPSNTGIRCFVRGKLPLGGRKKGQFECYESGRFLTVTGNALIGGPTTIEERTELLAVIHAEIFGLPEPPRPTPVRPSAPPNFSDRELIERAIAAVNGAAFSALWKGDLRSHGTDESAADLDLCDRLAFWTGGDAAWMDRLFRQSGLWRQKWDDRHAGDGRTYGQMTIAKAIEGATAFYSDAQLVGAPPADSAPDFMDLGAGDDGSIEKFLRGW